MNKKYLKLSIQTIFILLVLALALYLINQKMGNRLFRFGNDDSGQFATTTKDIMTEDEKFSLGLYHLGTFEVLSRNELGRPTSFKLISVEEPKAIGVDLMSDAEKAKKRISASTYVQVLKRDSSGRILEYRIMKDANDIMEKY